METFKIFLLEELRDYITPEEHNILNGVDAKSKSPNLTAFRRQNRSNSSFSPAGIGNGREYHKVKEHATIYIDHKAANVQTGMKLAYHGSLDKTDEPKFGVEQNRNEANPNYKPYHILQKDDSGNYHTNENGILLPTLDHHQDHHWIHTLHVEPLSNKTKLEDHTKTDEFPNGISSDDIDHAVMMGHNIKENDHPFIKQIHNLIKNTDISKNDISHSNIGIFTHPHTGKKYPVILDHGFTTGMLDK